MCCTTSLSSSLPKNGLMIMMRLKVHSSEEIHSVFSSVSILQKNCIPEFHFMSLSYIVYGMWLSISVSYNPTWHLFKGINVHEVHHLFFSSLWDVLHVTDHTIGCKQVLYMDLNVFGQTNAFPTLKWPQNFGFSTLSAMTQFKYACWLTLVLFSSFSFLY